MIIIASDWRSLAIRGAAAVLFGLVALVWPDITLLALVLLWGAYALVDGLATLWAVARGGPEVRGQRGLLALSGIASVAAGVLTFVWPGITALVLLFIIAAWALVTGVLEIVAGIRLRREINDEWRWILSGALSILFAAVLVITPGAGALAITWLIAWFAVFYGALLIKLAWDARKLETGSADTTARRPLRTQST